MKISKNLTFLLVTISLSGCTLFTSSFEEVEVTKSESSPKNVEKVVKEESKITTSEEKETLTNNEKVVKEESKITTSEEKETLTNNEKVIEAESPLADNQNNEDTLANNEVLFVSEKGLDESRKSLQSKEGTKQSPFRTLSFAIKQAKRIQEADRTKVISIQMEMGTYSESGLSIPSEISIKGRGDKTILLFNITLRENAQLSNLRVKGHEIRINSNDRNHDQVKLSNLFLENASININASSPQISDVKISNGEIDLRNSNATLKNITINDNEIGIFIGSNYNYSSSNPQLNTIKLSNVGKGIDIRYSSNNVAIKNLTITNSNYGIDNNGQMTIDNLTVTDSKYGIDNNGKMTIDNLTLNNSKYAGICNGNDGTILINGFNIGNGEVKTYENCPDENQEPPLVIPHIAGNVAGVNY